MQEEYNKLSESSRKISSALVRALRKVGTDNFMRIFGIKSEGTVSKFKNGFEQQELRWNVDSFAVFLDLAGYKVVDKTSEVLPKGFKAVPEDSKVLPDECLPVPLSICITAYLDAAAHLGEGNSQVKHYRNALIAVGVLKRSEGELIINVSDLIKARR